MSSLKVRLVAQHASHLLRFAGLALALLLGFAGSSSAGGFAAGVTTNFTTVSNPRAVVTGDVNNDGILDMVAPSSSGAGISVFRGLGGGAFAAAQSFPANACGVPVLGDFNQDGKLDIAVPLPSIGLIQFYNGNGDGTFTSGNSMSTPANAEFLVVGDFNGDGKADVATCGNATVSTGTVRVYLNTTSSPGGFETFAATDVAVAAQPRGIAAGMNLFGTHTLDLVTANQSAGSVSLLKNDGTGHFGNRLDVPTQKSCYAVTVGLLWAELNPGDSRPEIVTANKDSASVSMIVFNTTTSAWTAQKYATAADPRFVSLGDTDGNGNLDIVVSAFNSNVVSVLSTNFDGTSTWLKPHVDIAVGSHPWAASVVNLDGDNKPDLLVAVTSNNRISWVRGAPKRGWAPGDTIPAFSAKNQNGDTYSSSSLLGKWTVIDFCSGWCSPCRHMALTTQSTWLRWSGNPSVSFEYLTALIDGNVVGTASTSQDAIDWSTQYGITRPVLHSSDLPGAGIRVASQDAENFWTPTLRLIDPAGRVVWLSFGDAAESTIVRVIANAAGVPIPLEGNAAFLGGTETVSYGGQQVSSPSDIESGYTWPFFVTGFGENFTSDLAITRNLASLTEDWIVDLTYWPIDASHLALPTANVWQITLSNLQLDPATRTLPLPAATVVATDTFGVDHVLPAPVSAIWTGGTLTLGAIPPASLSGLPPLRKLSLSLTMMLGGWLTGVEGSASVATSVLRTPAPNPARSASRLTWSQPRAGIARLDVFDVSGRHVRTVTDRFQAAGEHHASWDLADERGGPVGVGCYFVRLLVAGEKPRTQRIAVVR